MAKVNISGTIKVIGQTQQVSEKFSKRELVINEPSGQYPQLIPIEFKQDKTSLLDGFKPDRAKNSCYLFHGSTPD